MPPIWLLLLLCLVATPTAATTSACHVDGLETSVRCGEVSVPVDHNEPDGDQLSVGFVVLPAFNTSSDRRPLFFLAGGPGQAASSLASRIDRLFAAARAKRDIVLIDQRGTGRSAALKCDAPELENLAPDEDLFDTAVLQRCIDGLPDTIAHFTTANAIRDFEAVRDYLGYRQIDLYGGSYGSRAALAYLAIAGEAVGSVILDGVSPPGLPIGLFGQSAAAAFERALARCAATPACASAYPDVRSQFAALDEQLRAQPIESRIPHPRTGEMTDLRLWHGQFISLLRLTLYDPDATALLPLLISEAAKENYLPLVALAHASSSANDINLMLNLNIVCNEDYPRFSAPAIERDGQNSFGGETSFQLWEQACPMMPRFSPDIDWMTPTRFDHPALLLSGAADPVTPPSNGELAATLFRSARHVVVPESAHIVASTECGGAMISEFLDTADPEAVSTDCIDEIPKQRFRLNRLGSLSTAAGLGADR